MARYYVFKDGEKVNTIAANKEFVTAYAEKNGYTFEEIVDPDPEPVEPEPTETEQLRADVDYIAIMTGVEL